MEQSNEVKKILADQRERETIATAEAMPKLTDALMTEEGFSLAEACNLLAWHYVGNTGESNIMLVAVDGLTHIFDLQE